MTRNKILWLLLVLVATAFPTFADEPVDAACDALFKNYVLGNDGRFSCDDERVLALKLIVERGRKTYFWRTLLDRVKNDSGEVGSVELLGRMLALDSSARLWLEHARAKGENLHAYQSTPFPYLGHEVVDELLKIADKAGGKHNDVYTFALASARDSRCQDYLRKVLGGDVKHYSPTAKFFAAMGLAELGAPEGVNWLIDQVGHERERGEAVFCEYCPEFSGANLSLCCSKALGMLSGENDAKTRADWGSWWEQVDKTPFTPCRVPCS
ncbi:MAG: hypothetical protein ABSD58_10460 [Verrucomicrobiia bacterium]|jgi:hypothetical protein